MKTTLKIIAAATALTCTGLSQPAFAGPGEDMARAHFNAIASADLDHITAHYTDHSVFEWIGGPLDGSYVGKAAITPLWQKFTGAQGKIKAQVSHLQEQANPAGVTVTADVRFMGQKTIPVRYVLTYRGDRLVNEIWQIAPDLGAR